MLTTCITSQEPTNKKGNSPMNNNIAIDNALDLIEEVRDVLSTVLENYPAPADHYRF